MMSSSRSSTYRTIVVTTHVVFGVVTLVWHYIAKRRRQQQQQRDGESLVVPPQRISEFEREASRHLSPLAKSYYNYYNGEGITAQECRRAYQSIRLVPAILTGDVTTVDTRVTVFNDNSETALELPVLVAPTAFHTLATPEGEVATARGAGRAGAGYCYNWMLSRRSYRDVLREPGLKWLHLYIYQERDLVARSIQLAAATGQFSAIILTCDHPHTRVQETMVQHFQHAPVIDDGPSDTPIMPNQADAGMPMLSTTEWTTDEDGVASDTPPGGVNDSTLSWEDVKWIRSLTKLPIVVKGVLSAHDARRAIECGVDGLVVSNHGGRQTDVAPPAIEALPVVVAAVRASKSRPDLPVWVDTGVRTGGDIIRALCLGATGVLVGRPALWALACDGSDGLQRMFETLKNDLQCDMRALGVTSISDLDLSRLWPPDRERIVQTVQACGEDPTLLPGAITT